MGVGCSVGATKWKAAFTCPCTPFNFCFSSRSQSQSIITRSWLLLLLLAEQTGFRKLSVLLLLPSSLSSHQIRSDQIGDWEIPNKMGWRGIGGRIESNHLFICFVLFYGGIACFIVSIWIGLDIYNSFIWVGDMAHIRTGDSLSSSCLPS